MPGGPPVWMNKLEHTNLESLFGFDQAFVHCPSHISRPFLPYWDNHSLVFPTGRVYYSEEVKYAETLGYKILPGYQLTEF